MTELKETFDPFSAAMDTLAAWVEPDPISARIDSYLAALSALDARYRADLVALYTTFQSDIVALIASGKHVPDAATVTLYRQERHYHDHAKGRHDRAR